jgi:hypothetical protein
VLTALWILVLSGQKFVLAEERMFAEPFPSAIPGPENVHPGPAETSPKPSVPTRMVSDLKETTPVADEANDSPEQDVLDQEIHLDRFFGNSTIETLRQTAYQLRLRNSFRAVESEKLQYRPSLRANVDLSGISDRLRLFFSEEIEPDPVARSLPEDPGDPGLDRTSQSVRLVNTELRYSLLKSTSSDIFLGAGARIVNPPEPFVRSRFQYTHEFGHVTLARLAETLFVNDTLGTGATTEASLERTLDPKTLLRWANKATVAKKIEGAEFGTELSLLHDLSSKSAVSLTGGIYGNSSLADVVTNYRLIARFRQNLLWSWLFYELDPEVSWPRNGNGDFPARLGITFVLEVVFEKVAAQKP